MTKDEELASRSFFNHDLTYKVTRDEPSYIEGFVEGLMAGRDLTETDLATIAYIQGVRYQKKKDVCHLDKAKRLIRNLLYVYQLGKNEPAIARVRLKAEEFLKEVES